MSYFEDLFACLHQLIEKAIVGSNKNHDIKYEIMVRKNHNSDKIVISSIRERSLVFSISVSSFRKQDCKPLSDAELQKNIQIAAHNVIDDLRNRILSYSQGGIDYTLFIQQGKLSSVQLTQHESRLKLYDGNSLKERESVSC